LRPKVGQIWIYQSSELYEVIRIEGIDSKNVEADSSVVYKKEVHKHRNIVNDPFTLWYDESDWPSNSTNLYSSHKVETIHTIIRTIF